MGKNNDNKPANGNDIPKLSSKNKLNDLTAREWLPETISVWLQKGLGKNHPDAQIEKQHPAPFSFTDVGRLINFFTKQGQTVLDPFVGIGSTLKACALANRNGIGIELNPKYAQLTKERLASEVHGNSTTKQIVINGDSRIEMNEMESDSVDFLVTSPPYWCILHKEDHKAKQERVSQNLDSRYSDLEADLGNIESYEIFLDELTAIFMKCSRLLKPNKYMAIIVGDFREKSRYYMFHADLAAALERQGMSLKGITILYQRHKRIFPYGYPYSFVPNLHHQYILILENTKHTKTLKRAKSQRGK